MAVEFTTAAIVKKELNDLTPYADADIEEIIEQEEGDLKHRLVIPDTFTFSASDKHHLPLRKAATLGAAIRVLASSTPSWNTLDQAILKMDQMVDMYNNTIAQLLKNNTYRDLVVNDEFG